MPFHLTPLHQTSVSRRQFLATTIAGACAATFQNSWAGDQPVDGSLVALLADTHIAADPGTILRDVRMADHLQQVVAQIIQAREPQTITILHGDAAMLKGEAGDYKTLGELLTPLASAELLTHVLLGNHDNRVYFRQGLADYGKLGALESKHAAVHDTPAATWVMLDSLDQVNVTPGKLGGEQIAWLAKTLAARPDKPAIVSVHHHPQFNAEGKIGGLTDTAALFEVLVPRKQVKAVVFGHTHNWNIAEHEGIHLVNLPPVAYVFNKTAPSGWVEARVGQKSLALTLRALNGHKQDGEKHVLQWR
ncbi:MAG: metallophosphoesterase [Pirellulaceae bacterium]